MINNEEIANHPNPTAQFDVTVKRLVDRIAKILQAHKCLVCLYDSGSKSLYGTSPAVGFDASDVARFERRVSEDGISTEVFRTGLPLILYDAGNDPRAEAEGFLSFGIYNAISVPLIVEKRDAEKNVVLEKTSVGVLHVFNKTNKEDFGADDVLLLQRMAMTAAAVLSSAQTYKGVAQENQELLHTIDSLYAGLIMIASSGVVVQINPSARAILGIPASVPVIGLPYGRAVPHHRVRKLLERSLALGGAEVADEISSRPLNSDTDGTGERIYQVQCTPVRDDSGSPPGIVAIFNDITEIRGVDQLKTAFISTVSHELRTPLTSIKGFISTLLEDEEGYYDSATRHEFYQIIDTECDRLTRLIKDLLDISRIEQGSAMQMYWDMVDVGQITNKVIIAQRAYAKNHAIVLDFPPNLPFVEADPDKIEQVLTNLINNAIKYSPGGGTVRAIGHLVGDHGQYVSIRVTDEGMGIAREHIPKLFDRFFRVDNRDNREIGGTGIGLALVKALMEAHHGTVKVESEPGKGSAFIITLPVKQPSTGKH